MSSEEERLAQLLKRVVPEPPAQLTADQITTQSPARPTPRAWLMPTLAAAAVAAIGVTVGLVATQRPDHGQTALSSATGSASPSPQTGATCQGRTVTVPNVVGMTKDAATAILRGVGLNAGFYFNAPPAGSRVPLGSVVNQSVAAGSKAVGGAEVVLQIATTPPGQGMNYIPTEWPTPPSRCQQASGTPAPLLPSERVPNVVGLSAAQATAVARAAGFIVSTVTAAATASHSVPRGIVYAQSPAPGSAAVTQLHMILYVAR